MDSNSDRLGDFENEGVTLAFKAKGGVRLYISLVASLPQIYLLFIHIGGYFPPLALLASFSLSGKLIHWFPALLKRSVGVAALALLVWYLFVGTWSPDLRLWGTHVVYLFV